MMSLFWRAANVDSSIIRSQSDRYRYASLGALAWVSASLAAIAFAYAVYVFLAPFMEEGNQAKMWAFISAPTWFFFVFHINRATIAVITLGNDKRFGKILPRLAVSVVISLTLSHPLVLFLLSEDISENYQLQIEKELLEQDDELHRLDNEIAALTAEIKQKQGEPTRREKKYKEKKAEKRRIEERIGKLNLELKKLNNDMNCERSGVGENCNVKQLGMGPSYNRLKGLYDKQEKIRDDLMKHRCSGFLCPMMETVIGDRHALVMSLFFYSLDRKVHE
uniref:DUF4407 domain-containing protein n=2 Tax=Candidatus Kentrum sp. FM TaxID=2126340 RepID=A0A450WZ79_9GAMM|nr:MAG: protein of unknown function (DUF4407) [Candidatus Kentron sp. FM]VFK22349.1 MAG: protein of unknown function (DUF4407) [Candidatus Kentron sp. FM]